MPNASRHDVPPAARNGAAANFARPPASRAHAFFALFYALAVVAALWQHGHPGMTLAVLATALPLAALAWTPYRWVPQLVRLMLHVLIGMAGLFWLLWRISSGVPMDKALVEGLAIAGGIFLGGERREDYGYLLMVSMFLMIYGSLLPRSAFLYAAAGGAPLLLLGLYLDRARGLSGAVDAVQVKRRSKRDLWGLAAFAVLLGGLFYWIFGLFPTRGIEREGVFEVSFQTENESMVPPEMRRWITSNRANAGVKNDPAGAAARPGTRNPEHDKQSSARVSGDAKSDSRENGLGASQGEDLLFCVKSPFKLYHLMRLYDIYDGRSWHASPMMTRVRMRNVDALQRKGFIATTEMKYVLTKIISRRLPAMFSVLSLDTFRSGRQTVRIGYDGGGAYLLPGEAMPATPFVYYASSQMLLPGDDADTFDKAPGTPSAARRPRRKNAPPPMTPAYHRPVGRAGAVSWWIENIGRNHYLKLPAKRIPVRVADLAYSLTWQLPRPYDKAIALREYLRKNYTYKLHAVPVPEGRESADYFLFELKEGHCEYFALALAVMARAVGLPARVAIGFSPGNYNSLTDQFEVYEYHGHAWTQIFIDGMGWLTMDATPPSAVQSRTTPLGIGQLRDPFGDEWRVTPPERTENTRRELARQIAERREKEQMAQQGPSKMEKAVLKVAESEEKLRGKLKKSYQKIQRKTQARGSLLSRWKSFRENLAGSLNRGFAAASSWLFRNGWNLLGLLTGLGGCAAGLRLAWRMFRHERRVKESDALARRAMLLAAASPEESVVSSYRSARLLLLAEDQPRRRNQELLAYAETANGGMPGTGGDLKMIFSRYYALEYGGQATCDDARDAAGALAAFRETVQKLRKTSKKGR